MRMQNAYPAAVGLVFLSALAAGCNSPSSGTSSAVGTVSDLAPVAAPEAAPSETTPAPTPTETVTPTPAPTQTGTPSLPPEPKPARTYQTDALLFVGSGTWSTEVSALESLLDKNGISYDTVTSAGLNGMSVDEIAQYGMIVWPGGSGGTQAGSLTSTTHANLRKAVQEKGVSYIGFCAGAFVGVAPAPAAGRDVSYGLGIVDGPILDYYYLENQGTDLAMTMATLADGSKHDLLWYGGPVTPNTPGGVVAKYPNGDPMITEVWSGNGFVMLSAVHPSVGGTVMGLRDSDGVDSQFALQLLQATLHQQPLPAF